MSLNFSKIFLLTFFFKLLLIIMYLYIKHIEIIEKKIIKLKYILYL